MLKTDYEAQVLDVFKGNGVSRGSTVVITIEGGADQNGSRNFVENPLPAAGEQELVFLRYGTKFYFAGGPEGRYAITPAGILKAVAPEFAVARELDGRSLASAADAIRVATGAKP